MLHMSNSFLLCFCNKLAINDIVHGLEVEVSQWSHDCQWPPDHLFVPPDAPRPDDVSCSKGIGEGSELHIVSILPTSVVPYLLQIYVQSLSTCVL